RAELRSHGVPVEGLVELRAVGGGAPVRMRKVIVAACFAALLGAGCGTPPAKIAQGIALTTGNTTYDDFFTAVRGVRGEALTAESAELASHAGLIKALGLEANAKPPLVIDEAGVRAKKFQERGVMLHLEIAPEPRIVEIKGKVEIGSDNEALIKSMEDA